MFAGTDQQDSHEFLIFLLNAMHSHHFPEEAPCTDEKRCKCLAHQVFGGESLSQITCAGCRAVNEKEEMMFDLGLQIRGKSRVMLNLTNGKGESVKGSPTSPSSSGGSASEFGESNFGDSIQDCLDR